MAAVLPSSSSLENLKYMIFICTGLKHLDDLTWQLKEVERALKSRVFYISIMSTYSYDAQTISIPCHFLV